jgi:hypothetical protein
MKLTHELKEQLLGAHERLPRDKKAEFVRRIRLRFQALQVNDLMGYTIMGALIGAICELLPLDTVTGVDDWVQVGAALGATIGYTRTSRERQARREAEQIIAEEVQRAFDDTH